MQIKVTPKPKDMANKQTMKINSKQKNMVNTKKIKELISILGNLAFDINR